jgi:hypothetical protein
LAIKRTIVPGGGVTIITGLPRVQGAITTNGVACEAAVGAGVIINGVTVITLFPAPLDKAIAAGGDDTAVQAGVRVRSVPVIAFLNPRVHHPISTGGHLTAV